MLRKRYFLYQWIR